MQSFKSMSSGEQGGFCKAPHPGFKKLWHIYFVDSNGKNIEHNSSVQFNRKIDSLRLIKLTMWLHKHLLTQMF
jgi:hypothetical protein